MDYDDRGQGLKRQYMYVTDSDSDRASTRRTRLRPVPNLTTQIKAEKKTAKDPDKLPS